jgi:hypothetical protein
MWTAARCTRFETARSPAASTQGASRPAPVARPTLALRAGFGGGALARRPATNLCAERGHGKKGTKEGTLRLLWHSPAPGLVRATCSKTKRRALRGPERGDVAAFVAFASSWFGSSDMLEDETEGPSRTSGSHTSFFARRAASTPAAQSHERRNVPLGCPGCAGSATHRCYRCYVPFPVPSPFPSPFPRAASTPAAQSHERRNVPLGCPGCAGSATHRCYRCYVPFPPRPLSPARPLSHPSVPFPRPLSPRDHV